MRPADPRWAAALAAGAMCGLAFPHVSAALPRLPVEALAWVCWVPLLLAWREGEGLGAVAGRAFVASLVTHALVAWWLARASLVAGLGGIALGAACAAVPWALAWGIDRVAGRRAAVWALPLLSVVWEWVCARTPAAVGWTVWDSQAGLWWLVGFADVTGKGGVTLWLGLVNVSVYTAWTAAPRPARERTSAGRRPLHPAARLAARLALVAAAFVAPAAAYSLARAAHVAREDARAVALGQALRVAAVQPNVNPAAHGGGDLAAAAADAAALGLARAAAPAHDLVVLPESALAGDPLRDTTAWRPLARLARSSGAALLVGTSVEPFVPEAARTAAMRAEGRVRARFNAAVLVTPERARRGLLPSDTAVTGSGLGAGRVVLPEGVHAKRHLMPLTEAVPYADRWPALGRFYVEDGAPWDVGPREAVPLAFRSRAGRSVRVGVLICYEQFYGATAARLVRGGANMLAAPSNEALFGETTASQLIGTSARFRAIETRRALVRATNTGLTFAIGPDGRLAGQIPPWQAGVASLRVVPRAGQTFYVRHPNALPLACALALVLIVATGALPKRRRPVGASADERCQGITNGWHAWR